jgi:methyltransferase (TIGR00027 family)
MATIDDVGRTAFNVACWRHQEGLKPAPLFVDPYAEHFLNEEVRHTADKIAQALPESRTMIQYRTRYLDDALAKQIASGIEQVVILGAGFDTRSLRQQRQDVAFFEVDRAPVLDFKQEALKRAGVSLESTYVACDYVADDPFSRLAKYGLNCSAPTYVIWEGNTMYLSKEDVTGTLEKTEKALNAFAISFDYVSDKVISRTTGFKAVSELTDRVERMGTPWLSGFAQDELAGLSSFHVVEDLTLAKVMGQCGPVNGAVNEVFSVYSVCTLQSRVH